MSQPSMAVPVRSARTRGRIWCLRGCRSQLMVPMGPRAKSVTGRGKSGHSRSGQNRPVRSAIVVMSGGGVV
jgi:hypothetical protein